MSESPGGPSRQETDEWLDHFVTRYFFSLIQGRISTVDEELREQGFDTDSPSRLQALRGNLFGLRSAYEDVYEVFKSQTLDQLEEESERVGNTPSREEGSD